jgi:hypothetical protein
MTTPPDPLDKPASRWRPTRRGVARLAGYLSLLVAGIVIGAAGHALFLRAQLRTLLEQPDQIVPLLMAKLRWDLSLRDDQLPRVETCVLRHQHAMSALHSEFLTRLHAEFDQFALEMEPPLDDTQRELFRSRFSAFRSTIVPFQAPAKPHHPPETQPTNPTKTP